MRHDLGDRIFVPGILRFHREPKFCILNPVFT